MWSRHKIMKTDKFHSIITKRFFWEEKSNAWNTISNQFWVKSNSPSLHLQWYMATFLRRIQRKPSNHQWPIFIEREELHQHPGPDRQSVSRGRRGNPNSMKISEGSKIIRSRKHEKYQSPTTSKTNFFM